MKIRGLSAIVALCSIATLSSISFKEEVAQAGQNDFFFGFVYARVNCGNDPGYGSGIPTSDRVLVSDVFTYCPYDPNLPHFADDAQVQIDEAAKQACPRGGTLTITSEYFRGAKSSQSAAENDKRYACSQFSGRCTNIAYIPAYYSKYNNPANCHP